jgi:hypothetical protein
MATARIRRDWPLQACRILTLFLMGVFALALAGLLVLFAMLMVDRPELAARTAGVNIVAALAIALSFRFVQLLGQIIGSVREGEPFAFRNVRRLNEMAVVALAYQIVFALAFVLGAGEFNFMKFGPLAGLFSTSGGLSLNSLVLALVLFVLARVFRHGAQLHDDLAGTV